MSGIPIFKIAISSLLQDAGEATRAIELARGLRENCPPGIKLEIVFFSHGSSFDNKIEMDGFSVHRVAPELPGVGFRHDLKSTVVDMVGDKELAVQLLQGEIDAIHEVRPDVFVHGFWPIAGVAAKIARVNKEIAYFPLPFAQDPFCTYLLKDIPDFLEHLTRLPIKVRKFIMAKMPPKFKLKAPLLKQNNIISAYQKVTRKTETPEMQNLFDMLKANFTIVNDLPVFYEGDPMPKNFQVVGPLFSPSEPYDEIDINILKRFAPENKNTKIFCTLGSSGESKNLLEAIRALTLGEHPEWDAVVVCPPSVCPIEEARALVGENPHIYLTDSFVPAVKVNGMADLVLSHGGQGTVQTAISCGTPIVGFAVQPEQQVNLDHLVERGAGIRIPIQQWQADEIRKALITVIENPAYHEHMAELQQILKGIDGKKNSAVAIWENIGNPISHLS
ncbi:MAG TPA: glycosyltransferase family 1 protein [Clostridiales bacterium]|nr:glycosyltransferase family 1 protein [Clostridiales bacterium]